MAPGRRNVDGRGTAWLLLALFATGTSASPPAGTPPPAEDPVALHDRFRHRVEELLAPNAKKGVYVGSEGWLFLRTEIQGAAGLSPCPPAGEGETRTLAPERTAGELPPTLRLRSTLSDAIGRDRRLRAAVAPARHSPLLFVLIPPKFDSLSRSPLRRLRSARASIWARASAAFWPTRSSARRITVLDLAPHLPRRVARAAPAALWRAGHPCGPRVMRRVSPRARSPRDCDRHGSGVRYLGIVAGTSEATTAEYCGDLREKVKAQRPPCSPLALHSPRRAPGGGATRRGRSPPRESDPAAERQQLVHGSGTARAASARALVDHG